MINKLIILVIALIVMFNALSCDSAVVNFPDNELEKVIREAIKKPDGPILRSDLEALDYLSALTCPK